MIGSAPSVATIIRSPVGWIVLVAHDDHLCRLLCHPDKSTLLCALQRSELHPLLEETPFLKEACREICAYFAGRLRHFSLPLDPGKHTSFTTQVLHALRRVPYGTTVTYGNLAATVGNPHAGRAVGRIMAANPLPIVIPCHRVVGAKGRLTGYSGGEGLVTKEWLLNFEKGIVDLS